LGSKRGVEDGLEENLLKKRKGRWGLQSTVLYRPGYHCSPLVTMIICGQNYRGLGNSPTVRSLLELKRVEDPDVLFLFETKLDEREMDLFRWKLGLVNMCVVKPKGRSRGLAAFWRKDLILSLRSFGRRHIDFDVEDGSGEKWRLTGVYGESQSERKKETWKMLRTLGQQHQSGRPWLCLGDFNEILTEDEKCSGAARPQACMDQFRDALDSCGLGDLEYTRDKFTWSIHCRSVDGYICERLHRVTGNAEWCSKFPSFTVENGSQAF
jgi:hypothetical protein